MTPDTLVVGAGLTGLLLAHRLTQAGQRVTLVEAREQWGGRLRRAGMPDFLPAGESELALIEWLRPHVPLPLHLEVVEHRPRIFDGRMRPFAGFGQSEFESVSELGGFGHAFEARLTPGLDQVVRALGEHLEVKTLSEVTHLEVENRNVTRVTLNDQKTITPGRVVFTAHPPRLNDLIAGTALASKHRTRLAKARSWTSVTVEFDRSGAESAVPDVAPNPATNIPGESGVLFFHHHARDFEPVVGRGVGANSRWLTLIPGDRAEDVEFIGQNIRFVKRQLKRAFPEVDLEAGERIFVHPHAAGRVDLKTSEVGHLPEILNLRVLNHLMFDEFGGLADVAAARALQVDFNPA